MTQRTDHIATLEGWNKYLDHLAAMAMKMAKEEEIKVVRFDLLLTAHPETGEASSGFIYTMLMKFDGEEGEVTAKKEEARTIVSLIAIAGCAVASSFTAEVWTSVHNISKTEKQQVHMQPKDDPERKEAVVIVSNHKTQGSQMRTALIDVHDNKRTVSDWEINDQAEMGGMFGNHIPPDVVISDKRAVSLARQMVKNMNIVGALVPIEVFADDGAMS